MWHELADVLNKINTLYGHLLDCSSRKHKALVGVDFKTLENVLDEEQRLTKAIEALEGQRKEVLKNLAASSRDINENTRMEQMLSLIPDNDLRESMKKLHIALNDVIRRVQDSEAANGILVQGALSAVNFRLNQLGGSRVEPAYGGKGQEVISHDRNFDFKA